MALRGRAVLHGFGSPEAFWQAATEGQLVESLDVLVTDYRFEDSASDGLSLARAIRQRRLDLVVAVSSSGLLREGDIAGVADVLLDKAALSWPELSAVVEKARRARSARALSAPEPEEHAHA
jgi:hypothetical protein